MAIAVPAGVGDRGVAERVRAADGAGARGGIGRSRCSPASHRWCSRCSGRSCSTAPALGFLSQTTHGVVLGQSFFAAAALLSLVGLPLVVASTREGLQAIPSHVREASYAVGKTKIATTRRVLLPAARPSVITGTMLGLGRVISDTAIVLLLLGGTLTFSTANSTPVLGPAPRHRRHADRLHLLQRADRRREPAVEGLRGGVRADADGARAQPRRRRRPQSLAEGGHVEVRKPPPVRRLTGNEGYAPRVDVAPRPSRSRARAAGERQRAWAELRVRGTLIPGDARHGDRDRPHAG